MSDLDRIPDWMAPDTTARHIDLKTWAQEFQDVYRIAEALCKTPFVPREMLGKQADVAAAIMKGRELGLDPFDALGSIYIVHGRVGFYAEFMRRRIIQAGHTLRIIENTDNRCIIEGTRKDGGDPQRAIFTAEQARKSGIDLGKYPADKLVARATSRLCRQVFPEVLSGSLIAEDLIDGLIPTDPVDPTELPPTVSAPVQRTRKTRAAKAAATQPKPAPTPVTPDPDIAELLDEDGALADVALEEDDTPYQPPPQPDTPGVENQPAGDDWADHPPVSPGPGQMDLLDEPGEDTRPITPEQLTKLSILLREAGFDTRESRHDFVSEAIDREIDSAKDLHLDEASRCIDLLEADRE